ncbi:MAG: hypothetical protein ACREIT_01610 [Tepidisphaeraceae bacterium]
MSQRRTSPKHPGTLAFALRALGRDDLPATIAVAGRTYRHACTVKHDFYAATGFYEDDAGLRVVLKMGRTNDFAGIPLEWLGRYLRARETRFYRTLCDLPNVPAILGTVGTTGFVHKFVSGQPLSNDRPVPDGFFQQLQNLIAELHWRGIAYVDTNKPENILLGDDGHPHLIDFQISHDLHELGDWWLNRWVLARLQKEDVYHFLKHKRRLRPDELTVEEEVASTRPSFWIRAHRFITKPYFLIRRRAFKRLRETGQLLPEGSK